MKREQIIEVLEKYDIDEYHWKLEIADEILALPLDVPNHNEIKLIELIQAYKNLLNCFGIKKPENKTYINALDSAWEQIALLEIELKKQLKSEQK